MDKFWKDNEQPKEKCIYCKNKVVPVVREYENTKRSICPICNATLTLVIKPKKLKTREW